MYTIPIVNARVEVLAVTTNPSRSKVSNAVLKREVLGDDLQKLQFSS
jgi:hypothetical protein